MVPLRKKVLKYGTPKPSQAPRHAVSRNATGSCGTTGMGQGLQVQPCLAVLEGAGDLVRVPKGLFKGIYRLPQRDLWGLGFRVYLEGQGT